MTSVALCAICLAVSNATTWGTWVHWIPGGILVALPLVVLGVLEMRRGRATLARGK